MSLLVNYYSVQSFTVILGRDSTSLPVIGLNTEWVWFVSILPRYDVLRT